jgi:phosphoglycerate dehydrogenase-like enzyme
LADTLEANPQLEWVQLPFAGVDAFNQIIQAKPVFTSAKRSYSEPVAEHALMLCMALGRILPERIRATSWGKKHADSLFDAEVLIVGGGGIAEQLVEMLLPFRSKITVVRKRPDSSFLPGFSGRIVGFEELDAELPKAQFVVLACALTDETRFLFNSDRFALMRADSYLVNISRGEIVDQDALLVALSSGQIAGAATDVTYPEPLPEGHPMWSEPRLIITPHTADTLPQVTRLFSERLRVNVNAWLSGQELTGVVDKELGY